MATLSLRLRDLVGELLVRVLVQRTELELAILHRALLPYDEDRARRDLPARNRRAVLAGDREVRVGHEGEGGLHLARPARVRPQAIHRNAEHDDAITEECGVLVAKFRQLGRA